VVRAFRSALRHSGSHAFAPGTSNNIPTRLPEEKSTATIGLELILKGGGNPYARTKRKNKRKRKTKEKNEEGGNSQAMVLFAASALAALLRTARDLCPRCLRSAARAFAGLWCFPGCFKEVVHQRSWLRSPLRPGSAVQARVILTRDACPAQPGLRCRGGGFKARTSSHSKAQARFSLRSWQRCSGSRDLCPRCLSSPARPSLGHGYVWGLGKKRGRGRQIRWLSWHGSLQVRLSQAWLQ
jgi:hypothetical protein